MLRLLALPVVAKVAPALAAPQARPCLTIDRLEPIMLEILEKQRQLNYLQSAMIDTV